MSKRLGFLDAIAAIFRSRNDEDATSREKGECRTVHLKLLMSREGSAAVRNLDENMMQILSSGENGRLPGFLESSSLSQDPSELAEDRGPSDGDQGSSSQIQKLTKYGRLHTVLAAA
jgi:hypothetical protein